MLNTVLSVGAGRAGLPAVEPLFAQSLWHTQESKNAFFVSLTLKVYRSLKASGSSNAEECSRTSEAAALPTCPATGPFSGRPLAQGEEGLLVGQFSSLRSRISDSLWMEAPVALMHHPGKQEMHLKLHYPVNDEERDDDDGRLWTNII